MINNCPVCFSDKTHILYSFSIEDVLSEITTSDQEKKRDRLKKIIENIWKNNEVSFYKCDNCKYGFALPYISGNSQYYSELYSANFKYPDEKWEYTVTINHIKKEGQNLKDQYYLELGAGGGLFLDLLARNNISKEHIFSTEYSKSACEYIISKGYYSANLSTSDFFNKSDLPKFDNFFMFQVLEHMDNIHEVFSSLNKVSKNGSNLFIAVPNEKLRGLLDKYHIYLDIPPTHIGKFSITTFRYIANKHGWKVHSFASEPTSYFSRVRKLLFSMYLKNSKAKKVEKSFGTMKRLLNRYIILFCISIKYFILLIKLRDNDLGTSFWIHMKKE